MNFVNKNILNFDSNYALYDYMYGTYRHTNRSCLQRAAGDFYVYVYIQIRALGRIKINVTELRILNYGDKRMFQILETKEYLFPAIRQ